MSEHVAIDFYSVKNAPLVELAGLEHNPIVRAELKKRAAGQLESAYKLYVSLFGCEAAEQLSADAAGLFVGVRTEKGESA